MKFSEHLTAHVTPEWHKQYVTYEVTVRYCAQVRRVLCSDHGRVHHQAEKAVTFGGGF
jgi:SPX domain protein involved in polyphosphate accumulation